MNKANPKQIVFAVILLLGLVAILYFVIQSELNEFDENGLAKRATITKLYSKREVKVHGKGSFETNYYADISFFVKESDTRSGVKDVITDTSTKKKSLDELIEGLDFSVELGDYQTATLKMSEDNYEALQNAKTVEILYLKDNPEKVMLKEGFD